MSDELAAAHAARAEQKAEAFRRLAVKALHLGNVRKHDEYLRRADRITAERRF